MTDTFQEVNLSIIVVNFRTPKLLTDCLTSLLPEINGLDARIIVVDNNSQDDSPVLIQKWINKYDYESNVQFIQSENNEGFASGNNIGIKALKAKYYLLLNSDTIVKTGAIKTLLETIAQYPRSGIISPRLEWPNGDGQKS